MAGFSLGSDDRMIPRLGKVIVPLDFAIHRGQFFPAPTKKYLSLDINIRMRFTTTIEQRQQINGREGMAPERTELIGAQTIPGLFFYFSLWLFVIGSVFPFVMEIDWLGLMIVVTEMDGVVVAG